MRSSPIFAACSLVFASASCLASTGAPVTAVVLYPGSASITRTAQVVPGAHEVVLTGLPANFDVQTMRVSASGGLRVGAVTTLDAAGSQVLNPAEASLRDQIEALSDQKAMLDAQAGAAQIVKTYLERLNAGGEGSKPAPVADGKALAGLIDTLGKGASNALVKIQAIAVQQRTIDLKIDVLKRDLARLQSGTRDARAVTIALAGAQGGTVTINYQLNNAGWKPGYRASLDSGASTVELTRMATVAQHTGEDWSNVRLTLSTGQPRQSPTGRVPQPWLLSWSVPQPQKPMLAGMARAAAPAPTAQRVEITGSSNKLALEEAIDASFMTEVQSTFATEFQVPERVSLASDGRAVTLALSSQNLPAKQYVRVAPRLERFGIIMAETTRPDGVWPAGPLQLFRDGNYVGATHWNLQDGKRTEFAFGRDELLNVSVDAVDGKTGSKGVFGTRNAKNTADVFTLTSRHSKPLNLLVLESSPVSTADEIKVQAVFAPKPTVTAWEDRRGVVAWQTSIAPAASLSFQVEYQIEYPKDGVLVGLR
ncbi:mucoidy inhibitor MuiA family protein [Massilia sp. CF038]|uniref:mucoidy inhibitor MuiA family protein n=1 Tax=Massilia sp. CF038 TaxID=1881045 RepID=UPI0009156FF5|nr:mucoidy inhibitor MuiA family protein [Massilia sp. CF038]SHH46251.1 conserved hypothetical protein [Massilia sp. CF038]